MADPNPVLDALISSQVADNSVSGPSNPPDVSGLPSASVAPPQAPVQAQTQQRQGPRPILFDLIQGLRGQNQQVGPGGALAPPISRAQSFENFLGNFTYALSQGYSQEGRGPGAAMRGAGAALAAPYQLGIQQQQLAQQQQLGQAQIAQEQARTGQIQRQTELAGSMVTIPSAGGPIMVPYNVAIQSGLLKGLAAAQTNVAAKRYQNVPQVGLVDTQAQGGPQVVVPNRNGGVPITSDLAKQFGIPSDFVGQNIDLKTIATLEKLGPTTQTKLTRDPVTGLVTTATTTTTRGAGGAAAPGTAPTGGTPSGFPKAGTAAGAGGTPTTKWDPSSIPVQLVEGQMDPAQLSKRGTSYNYYLQEADRYSREKYGRPFDAGQASIDYAYARNTQTQNTLKMIAGITEKGGALDIAKDAAKALPQFDSQTVNKIFNAFETQFGSANATNFHTAMLGLADEYSKVMGGGISSDTGRQQALDILKAAYSKGQLGGAIDIMQKDLMARQTALIGGNRYLQKQFGGAAPATGNNVVDSLVSKYGRRP